MNEIIENIKSKNSFIIYLHNNKNYNKEYFYCFAFFPFFIISLYLSTLNNLESILYFIATIVFFTISLLPLKEYFRVKKIKEDIKYEEKKYANDIKTLVFTTDWKNFNKKERLKFIYYILDNEYSNKNKLSDYILKFDYKFDNLT